MALRRTARNIEVFDISLMAVVTKAMGAFLVMTVLLLPYYSSDPDIGASSAAAQDSVNAMRKQIDDMARQIGAGGADPAAMAKALKAMQDALDAARQRIDDLAKQGDALASQLREARKAAADAQREADAAKEAASKARARMRQAEGAAAELEDAANRQARQASASQAAAAGLESAANQQARQASAGAAAAAADEAMANHLQQVLRQSALAPRWLLLTAWRTDAACAGADIRMAQYRSDSGTGLPGGISMAGLGPLGEGLLQRSARLHGSAPPVGTPDAGAPGAAGTQGIQFAGIQDAAPHALIYAYAARPLTAPCKIGLDTVMFDLLHGTSARAAASATLPPGGDPVPMMTVDAGATTTLLAPDAAAMTAWNERLPALRKELEQAPGAAPPGAPR